MAKTRLGPYGGAMRPYGSFAGKAVQVLVEGAARLRGVLTRALRLAGGVPRRQQLTGAVARDATVAGGVTSSSALAATTARRLTGGGDVTRHPP